MSSDNSTGLARVLDPEQSGSTETQPLGSLDKAPCRTSDLPLVFLAERLELPTAAGRAPLRQNMQTQLWRRFRPTSRRQSLAMVRYDRGRHLGSRLLGRVFNGWASPAALLEGPEEWLPRRRATSPPGWA